MHPPRKVVCCSWRHRMPHFAVQVKNTETGQMVSMNITAQNSRIAMKAAEAMGTFQAMDAVEVAPPPSQAVQSEAVHRMAKAVERMERRQRFSWGRVFALLVILPMTIIALIWAIQAALSR